MTFLPAADPTSRDIVKARLDITDTDDDDLLAVTVAAVNAKIREWPVADRARQVDQATADTVGWSAAVQEGATLLAMRLWRRKDSPAGVVAFGDQGAVYVQRNDPDIAMLLNLGAHMRPAVG